MNSVESVGRRNREGTSVKDTEPSLNTTGEAVTDEGSTDHSVNTTTNAPTPDSFASNILQTTAVVTASSRLGLRSNEKNTENLPVPKSHLTNTANGYHCLVHCPTLEELESLNSLGSYIRTRVLPAANTYEVNTNHPEYRKDMYMDTKMELCEGMALIRFPEGFGCSRAAVDRTGRNAEHWGSGTILGDWVIKSPIEQHVRGMAGVYEYTFVDKPSVTISEFRSRADKYKDEQIGNFLKRLKIQKQEQKNEKLPHKHGFEDHSQARNNNTDQDEGVELVHGKEINGSVSHTALDFKACDVQETCNLQDQDGVDVFLLERQFWKRISPTMPPSWYGADQEDTLFLLDEEIDQSDALACNAAASWSLSKLDSCLQVLPPIPGVTSPYLYVGMWGSVFCAHTEDMNLLSINYLHAGSPKFWYSVAEPDAKRFLSLVEHYYAREFARCKEFMRHKRYLLSPAILQKAGIKYQIAVQFPGDAIITMPGAFHFGFNLGFNVAEATNFGVPEWLPFGRLAKVCLCRHDSVRIDMHRLALLIQKFQCDQKRNRRLTYSEWRRKRVWETKIKQTSNSATCIDTSESDLNYCNEVCDNIRKRKYKGNGAKKKNKTKLSEQQLKNEFWVEVMKPVASTSSAVNDKKKKTKRKKKSQTQSRPTEAGRNHERKKVTEVWHLAKPINKSSNRLFVSSRVLCIIPASQNLELNSNAIGCSFSAPDQFSSKSITDNDNENDYAGYGFEEQCFAGQVTEVSDDNNFVRIHLNGLPRTDDIWMNVGSPRLFLDGGQWTDSVEENALAPLHYWQEMDSRNRLR